MPKPPKSCEKCGSSWIERMAYDIEQEFDIKLSSCMVCGKIYYRG